MSYVSGSNLGQATKDAVDRLIVVTRYTSPDPDARTIPSYQVAAPRVCDALGMALRNAYERDLGLPEDMANLLRRLNTADTRSV